MAVPDFRDAMLCSLDAMTTHGHARGSRGPHGQMMGAPEARDGLVSFGLTTAFLFPVVRTVWPASRNGTKW